MGVVVCDISLKVSVNVTLFPPRHLTLKTTPNHPFPLPAALRWGDYALLSLPFVWGASLGTVFTSAVAFFTSVSPFVPPSFTALPLWGWRKGAGEKKKRGDSVNSESPRLSLSLSKLNCLLWAAFCVIYSKKEKNEKGVGGGGDMQDALREFVFPSGTECISHIMGSSSLS